MQFHCFQSSYNIFGMTKLLTCLNSIKLGIVPLNKIGDMLTWTSYRLLLLKNLSQIFPKLLVLTRELCQKKKKDLVTQEKHFILRSFNNLSVVVKYVNTCIIISTLPIMLKNLEKESLKYNFVQHVLVS